MPAPTYASHVNRTQCHFQPLREFVLNASNHEVARAFLRYLYPPQVRP
ncbi:MAG: hypothetical protein JO023_02085 [Chloroflexi bacterium]|nr:hypothetical protein [Chloroflexota bacterium]